MEIKIFILGHFLKYILNINIKNLSYIYNIYFYYKYNKINNKQYIK